MASDQRQNFSTPDVRSVRCTLSVAVLRVTLARLHRRLPMRRRARRVTTRRLALLVALLGLGTVLFLLLPVVHFEAPLSTAIYDREGQLLGAGIAADGQWRFGPPDEVPEKYRVALVRFEDRRFFRHPGVDLLAVARAARQNLAAGRIVSGGSTITMQVVRLARLGRARNALQKFVEAILAIRLELASSKEEILRLHAAYAPFGGNVVGLEAASWRYFSRPPDQLSWAEAATLAVLPNSPALIHPGRNRDQLLAKRNRLLDELRKAGVLDSRSCSLAQQESLPEQPAPLPALAPHLLERVRAERIPEPLARSSGVGRSTAGHYRAACAPEGRADAGTIHHSEARVRTTLVRALQVQAIEVIGRHQKRLAGNGVHNVAALVLDVASNEVLAYVGNVHDVANVEHDSYVDVIPARRSTGSLLKPFLYAAMIESGEILPHQLVPDIPTRFDGFAPQNYDRTYSGAVSASVALARSLNVSSVRMLQSYGVDRFYGVLKKLGMSTLHRRAEEYGLTLILGGAECTLEEITSMYAGLAHTVHRYPEASDREGSSLGAGACYETLKALLEVRRPGVEGAWRSFAFSRKIAWKTGTSYGHRDAWAIGVTPRYAVGVWVGNADGEGRPGLTGHAAAAPILFELFGALDTGDWFIPPAREMLEIEVCAASGLRSGRDCARTQRIMAPRTTLRGDVCHYCRLVHCDPTLTWRVDADCQPVADLRSEPWFVLPPVMEWYYARVHSDYRTLPPYRADCRESASQDLASLSCIFPTSGSVLYVPLELDGSRGQTVFEVAHRRARTRVFWHLDDEYLGTTEDLHQMALAPEPGEHVLTLVDENGEQLKRFFTVLSRD